jgi:glucokinase
MPNLPRWEGRVSAQRIADAVELPVLVANDADLAALGEHRFGAGRGVDDLVYITVSTGVGGGVIAGGRLLHGRRSLAEIGHLIIDRESGKTVEDLGSGTALERISGMRGAEVTELAQHGDERALEAFRRVADALAVGVINAVEAFVPQRVVVGGGVSQAGDLLFGPVRERLAASRAGRLLAASGVVRAELGDDAGLYGAFTLWRDSVAPPHEAVPLRPFEPSRG